MTKPLAKRKRRVRKHIIADLSRNHVEYKLLKAGDTMVVDPADYGYDGSITTFDSNGEIENGYVFIQLKATDHLSKLKNAAGLRYTLSKQHIDLWHDEPMPVYLVLFDAIKEVAYWLYLQRYFAKQRIDPAKITGKSLTVYIDPANVFGTATPAQWRDDKLAVLGQITGKISHV